MSLAFVLWVAFFVGQCVYILIRASWAIRSKTNPVSSRLDFLYVWWDVILIRTLIEAALFWLYWAYPDILTAAVAKAGFTWNLTLPLVPPVAFFIGLTSDVILDSFLGRFTVFQKDIPHLPVPNGNGGIPPAAADQAQAQGAGK